MTPEPTDTLLGPSDSEVEAFEQRLYKLVDEHDVISEFVSWHYTERGRAARLRVQVDGVHRYGECTVYADWPDEHISEAVDAAIRDMEA